VGAILRSPDGRLLVIQRGQEPSAGQWSVPGGRVEPGETDAQALVREVREETGLEVAVGDLVGVVEREGLGGAVYVIRDHACSLLGGHLAAATDAADARWVTDDELRELTCVPGLVGELEEWGVVDRR
jgi:mutator protein MutT